MLAVFVFNFKLLTLQPFLLVVLDFTSKQPTLQPYMLAVFVFNFKLLTLQLFLLVVLDLNSKQLTAIDSP